VHLNTSRGLRLQTIANSTAQASLRDPLAYGPTQQLGAWMRDQGIGAFEYLSAELTADHTTFLSQGDGKLHRFGRELFLIDGAFPGAAD
jgi:hypothetical protein